MLRPVMANTFTSLHVHIVFSTKNRERWLTADVEEDVWRYLGGICLAHNFTALQIGGVEENVHLLLG
jgi:putative transposase